MKRYNAIVEHLEEENVIPENLWPALDDDETNYGQLGAEASLLADYLNDVAEEAPGPPPHREKHEGLGPLIALAPFLGSEELSKLVRQRLGVDTAPAPPAPPAPPASPQGPDLQMIVGLAPHIDSATLAEMVRACLSRQKITDPNLLIALAPHMNSADLSQLLREQLPEWIGAAPERSEENPAEPGTPTARGVKTSWTEHATPPTPPVLPTPPTPPSPRAEELR